MSKFLRISLYIISLLLYSTNLESSNNKNVSNNLKPSVVWYNKSTNNKDISINKQQFNKFKEEIKDKTIAEQALMLGASAIDNAFYNLKEFKYLSTYKDINTWSYFNAMKRGLESFINKISKDKIKISNMMENNSNPLLDKVAEFYINYFITRDSNVLDKFLLENKIDSKVLHKIIENLSALGFNKIIQQVIVGTDKFKELIDNKCKLNNKELSENKTSDNEALFIKLDNQTGICWLNSAFQLLYTTTINCDILSNTMFDRFINFLYKRQEEWRKEVKKKDYKELISEDRQLELSGIRIVKKYKQLTDKITLIDELKNFEKTLGKEELNKWNKDKNVISSKNELKKLKTMQSQGNSEIHGIKLLLNIFPELKKIFQVEYTNKKHNINITSANVIFGHAIIGEVTALINLYPRSKKQQRHYKLLTQPMYSTGIMVKDEIINEKTSTIEKLPEYLIINASHYENDKKDVLEAGLTFDKIHNNYISGFNENGELVIYKLSSTGMSRDGKSSRSHGYAMYKGNDNWYVMDDNDPYKKLTQTEFDDIIKKDKASTFIYKRIYCETASKSNNQSNNRKDAVKKTNKKSKN